MNESGPSLSVILPVYNGEDTIGAQLEALAGQSAEKGWELIVSDNGGSDRSMEIVARYEEVLPLRLVDSSQRRGFSAACNIAAGVAAGDHLVFIGQDDVANPGWLSAMERALADADIVAGAMEYGRLNPPEILSLFDHPERDTSPRTSTFRFLPYAVGTNLGISAAAFGELGGWNEDLMGGSEDVELSWRAQLLGYAFDFAPDALMSFRYPDDLTALFKKRVTYASTHPFLYRQFRRHGAPRSSLRAALASYAWLLTHLAQLTGPGRGEWLKRASVRWGRLVGSLRYRSLYL